jgi:hypothetical protein
MKTDPKYETFLFELLAETLRELDIGLQTSSIKNLVDTRSHPDELPLALQSGSYLLKGKRTIVLHPHLTLKEKNKVILKELSRLDLEHIHLPPVIRDQLIPLS